MAPDTDRHQSLWLWVAGAFVSVAVASAGIAGGFAAAEKTSLPWDSPGLVVAYVSVVLAIGCVIAAARGWRFPLTRTEVATDPPGLEGGRPVSPLRAVEMIAAEQQRQLIRQAAKRGDPKEQLRELSRTGHRLRLSLGNNPTGPQRTKAEPKVNDFMAEVAVIVHNYAPEYLGSIESIPKYAAGELTDIPLTQGAIFVEEYLDRVLAVIDDAIKVVGGEGGR